LFLALKTPLVSAVPCPWRRSSLFRPSGVTLSEQSEPNPAEPIFNVPAAVVATVAVLVLVHAVRGLLLSDRQDVEFVLTFGFIPARYGGEAVLGGALPGGFAADLWTFFSYAFIHADLTDPVWQCAGAPVRRLALCSVHADDGGDWGDGAPDQPSRRS
jgi:hypothetical protein